MRKISIAVAALGMLSLLGAGCMTTANVNSNENNAALNTNVNANANTTTNNGQGRIVVAMTGEGSALTGVTAVTVNVSKTEVHSTSSGWITVSTATKSYDLLQLKSQSVSKLLADSNVAADTYDKVRLTIDSVQLTVNNKTVTAKLPSNMLEIVGNFTVSADQTSTATLDFMIDKSLHLTGNGTYILAPVVKLTTMSDATATLTSDDAVDISGGRTETDETVGTDVDGQTRANFMLPDSLKVDASGKIQVGS